MHFSITGLQNKTPWVFILNARFAPPILLKTEGGVIILKSQYRDAPPREAAPRGAQCPLRSSRKLGGTNDFQVFCQMAPPHVAPCVFTRFYKGFGQHFTPFEPLCATHYAFGLCFIRVSARWKGYENHFHSLQKTDFTQVFTSFVRFGAKVINLARNRYKRNAFCFLFELLFRHTCEKVP